MGWGLGFHLVFAILYRLPQPLSHPQVATLGRADPNISSRVDGFSYSLADNPRGYKCVRYRRFLMSGNVETFGKVAATSECVKQGSDL